MIRCTFTGAVKNVTGSCHLIEVGDRKILLDCGMFQGTEAEEKENALPFPFNPKEIDAVLLSHAHIDHSGRIPLLFGRGYQGLVYCTHATLELAEVMLMDSGSIQEKDAQWAGKKAQRRGEPLPVPLYTQEQAEACLENFVPLDYGELREILPGIRVRFQDAGHLLGSAMTEVWLEEEGEEPLKLVYSGDVGTRDKVLVEDPTPIREADALIMEATYGDRVHPPKEESLAALLEIIRETGQRGGNVLIPSFAMGRTQELIHALDRFFQTPEGAPLAHMPVYVDSPLATRITEIFRRNRRYMDQDARDEATFLAFGNLRFTRSAEESKALNRDPVPKVIIASGGMCQSGRILHHLKHNLWREECSLVFVGYQGEGTLGREIQDGAGHVRVLEEELAVRCQVHSLQGFSGHGDQEDLLSWLGGFQPAPEEVFLVHGEAGAKEALGELARERLGIPCKVIREPGTVVLKKKREGDGEVE